jgi:peptidoglycan/xylan/chitin deacetylase (PgdA/CDA1 family)
MKSYNAKATFFITGNNINKGQIDITPEFRDVIKRQEAEGHQIASHTWTHLDLGAITTEERYDQMIKNEMALRNILGYIPTYMRPPYSSCAGQCEQDMADLGYHVTYFDIDTDDYNQDAPEKIQNAKDNFLGNITKGNASPQTSQWLEIGHDIHEQTVNNLTEYMLQTLTQLGYRGVTVGECLGDPKENWYRQVGGAGQAAPATTAAASAPTGNSPVSTDGQCGASKGRSCLGSEFGNCCSSAGWCGKSSDHCGNGCQSAFGNCGSNGNAPAAPAPTSTRAATPSAAPASNSKVSTDGSCGKGSGFTCQGSSFGNCCSQYNYCGSTTGHCSTGCQSAFGTCSNSASPAPAPAPAPAPKKKVSTDGSCGQGSGFTCQGSSFGNCCSQYNYCGSTTGHCSTGCQSAFGTCK